MFYDVMAYEIVIGRSAKIFTITKRLYGFFAAGGNLTYRKYYKRDFHF